MIIAQVINEFLEIDNDNIDAIKISEIKGGQIIKYISSYFIGTLKKVEYIPEKYYKHCGYFIRNMMNTVMRTIGLDVKYCNKLLKNFGKGFLSFQEFIEKYNLPQIYFKEYYYAAFSGLFILIFGKIKNFELYDIIIRLWILVDNIFDNKEEGNCFSNLQKEIFELFKIILDKEKRIEFLDRESNSPIIECFKNIEEMKLSDKKKNGLYLRFYKLFKFSYKKGGIEEKENYIGKSDFDILVNCCLKTKKALDIFFYAIDYQKKKEDKYKIYHMSLIIQLLDDLMDIRKDKLEKKITIFNRNEVENTKNAIRLFKFIKNSKIIQESNFQIFYEGLIFFFIDFNSEFFETSFIQKIRDECSIMDLKYYNLKEIDCLIESEIMKKIIYIYLK
jgi:hypothetical protein